jgi:hypothetical protein
VARFAGPERRGISLRMGSFYGPDPTSWQLLRYARMGIAAFPPGALVAAMTQPVPSGVYDLVDDEPLTRGEVFAALAQAVGRKHLWQPPTDDHTCAASGPSRGSHAGTLLAGR